jgi:prevent-host-death family protein
MEHSIISMREIQRNYKSILEKAKTRKGPVFLGAHGKTEAVLMDIAEFRKLQESVDVRKKKRKWEELKRTLDRLASKGSQNISLSEFVIRDRHAH